MKDKMRRRGPNRPRREAQRKPGSMRRWIAISFCLAGALWVGYQATADTIAFSQAADDPALALEWRPDDSRALIRLAEQRFTADDQDAEVADLARRALAADPLEGRAFRILGQVAAQAGDQEHARQLMTIAADRLPRDPIAQAWLFDDAASRGDLSEALSRADAIMRTQPQLWSGVLAALTKLAADSASAPILAASLATDPPWRSAFLRTLASSSEEPVIAWRVFRALQGSASPPTSAELMPFFDRLIGSGQYEVAFLDWLETLPPEQRSPMPYVYNGDFELPVTNLPFDWTITSQPGTRIDFTSNDGHALHIEFSDTRVSLRNVRKLLILPPGSYRFSGSVRAEDLRNERGLWWRIECADGDKKLLATTERISGTIRWWSFDTDFDVPMSGCRAQWLTLELAARVALEQQVSGNIWYDGLSITRDQPPASQ